MPKTISVLRKELVVKEKQLAKLQAKRDKLLSQLEQVDRQIAGLNGQRKPTQKRLKKTGRKKRRKRSGRQNLGDVLADVLKQAEPVKASDAADMALKAGYKTNSKKFVNLIRQTLISDDRFRKVQRGLYKVK